MTCARTYLSRHPLQAALFVWAESAAVGDLVADVYRNQPDASGSLLFVAWVDAAVFSFLNQSDKVGRTSKQQAARLLAADAAGSNSGVRDRRDDRQSAHARVADDGRQRRDRDRERDRHDRRNDRDQRG